MNVSSTVSSRPKVAWRGVSGAAALALLSQKVLLTRWAVKSRFEANTGREAFSRLRSRLKTLMLKAG